MLGAPVFRTALFGPWSGNALWTAARAVPSLDLRFADNKSLTDAVTGASLITFTRASSATYVDSAGVLQTAVTNLLLRSEEIGTSPWGTNVSGSVTYTANATAAPTGAVTADRVTATADFAGPNQFASVTSGLSYTFSFYIKAVSAGIKDQIRIEFFGWFAQFRISTLAFSSVNPLITTTSAQPAGDGWVRVVLTALAPSTGSLALATYANTDADFYLWGAQLEQSATVGEYIPTTSTINSAPRFNHNPTTGESLGLLVEEARTNLMTYSEQLNDVIWGPVAGTVTANAITAPNGTITADLVTTNGTQAQLSQGTTISSGATITGSCFLKPNGINETEIVLLASNNTTPYGRATFNISTGVISVAAATANGGTNASASIQAFTNGWYRCSVTVTYPAVTSAGIRINAAGATGGIYLWGAQLEAGAFPTSYIPTTTATATRSADVASITGTAFSGWYRQDEGTVFVSGVSAPNNTIAQVCVDISDTIGNERMFMRRTSAGSLGFAVVDGAATQADVGAGPVIPGGAPFATAASYRLNSINLATSGQIGTEDTSATIPTPDRMFIAQNFASTQQVNGHIRRLTYWPTRLANTTIQAITQP